LQQLLGARHAHNVALVALACRRFLRHLGDAPLKLGHLGRQLLGGDAGHEARQVLNRAPAVARLELWSSGMS
jgi:hypothetical protein